MARVVFEDSVETKKEFWALLGMLAGDRDLALGKLVRFFRIAQDAFSKGRPMTASELADEGLTAMIESGWAKPIAGGFEGMGCKKHAAWLLQRVEAGKARAGATRNAAGQFDPAESSDGPAAIQRNPAGDQRNPAPIQPLALALAPSLALAKKQNKSSTGVTSALVPTGNSPPGRTFVAAYVKAFQARYGAGTRPQITGKVAGQIQTLLKSVPLDRAVQLIQVYLQMDDRWFETKHHDFTSFAENLNKIGVALDTGQNPGGVDWGQVFGSAHEPS